MKESAEVDRLVKVVAAFQKITEIWFKRQAISVTENSTRQSNDPTTSQRHILAYNKNDPIDLSDIPSEVTNLNVDELHALRIQLASTLLKEVDNKLGQTNINQFKARTLFD